MSDYTPENTTVKIVNMVAYRAIGLASVDIDSLLVVLRQHEKAGTWRDPGGVLENLAIAADELAKANLSLEKVL